MFAACKLLTNGDPLTTDSAPDALTTHSEHRSSVGRLEFTSMADGTYQLTGPASAAQARAVVFTASPQQKGGWDNVSTFTTSFGSNADILYQGNNDPTNLLTITYAVAGNSTALTVGVSGHDITVNVATDSGGAATSTASQVLAAVQASSAVTALGVVAVLAAGSDGTGVVAALAKTSFAGGSASDRGTLSSAPLPHEHPIYNSYN